MTHLKTPGQSRLRFQITMSRGTAKRLRDLQKSDRRNRSYTLEMLVDNEYRRRVTTPETLPPAMSPAA